MAVHYLKCWPDPFQATFEGRKTAEFRRNDRNFAEGDLLIEEEWIPEGQGYPEPYGYTGAVVCSLVTDLRIGGLFGIPEDHCMMSKVVLYRQTRMREILLPAPPSSSAHPREVFRTIAREQISSRKRTPESS